MAPTTAHGGQYRNAMLRCEAPNSEAVAGATSSFCLAPIECSSCSSALGNAPLGTHPVPSTTGLWSVGECFSAAGSVVLEAEVR